MFRVGGIGGVATNPEFRRRGVASAMLARAAEFMKNDLCRGGRRQYRFALPVLPEQGGAGSRGY
jgi:ribosomal protein S18 acetylase RimI-like enzyme